MTDRRISWLLAAAVLAGCSSGSGPAATPVTPHGTAARLGSASFKITIPQRPPAAAGARRHRNFVSPSTDGIAVEVTHKTAGTTDYDVTTNFDVAAGSPDSCADSVPQVCTLVIPAPVAESPDFDTFTFTLYDKAPGGTPPTFGSSANVLGAGTTTASIVANAGNTISAYVDGLPASIAFSKLVVSGDGYLGFSAPVAVTAYDIDLNPITGGTYDPYSPALSLSVSEPEPPFSSTTLAVTPPSFAGVSPAPPACDAAATGQAQISACRTADAITASYVQPGQGSIDLSYFATIGSGSSAVTNATPLYVSPIFITDTVDSNTQTASAPYFTQGDAGASPLLNLDGATGTITLIEPGSVTEGTAPTFTAAQSPSCSAVIAPSGIVASSATTYTITGVTPASAGENGCIVTFTDSFGGTVQLAVADGPIVTSTPANASRVRRIPAVSHTR